MGANVNSNSNKGQSLSIARACPRHPTIIPAFTWSRAVDQRRPERTLRNVRRTWTAASTTSAIEATILITVGIGIATTNSSTVRNTSRRMMRSIL